PRKPPAGSTTSAPCAPPNSSSRRPSVKLTVSIADILCGVTPERSDIASDPLPGAAPAHHACFALASEAMAPLGLTVKHYACLRAIASEGPLSQQELGALLGIDRTTVVAVVDDLERKRLVARRRNPRDRRAYALEATAAGRSWLERVAPIVADAQDRMCAQLAAGERAELTRLLKALIAGAEEAAGEERRLSQ